jgi:hypothetical protein
MREAGCVTGVDNCAPLHYEFTGRRLETFGRLSVLSQTMPRTKKKPATAKGRRHNSLDEHNHDESDEQGLPSDEVGRLKIKKNYEDLLGIRVEKLKGRVLNREKINKSIDGIYFVCFACKKICHNLDEGWVENPQDQMNYCGACSKAKGIKSATT